MRGPCLGWGGAGRTCAQGRPSCSNPTPCRLLACRLPGPCCLPPLPPLPQDEREKKWRIQAVGVAPGSFDSRKALPVPWRGLRDAELRCAAGWQAGWLAGH